MLQVEQNPFLGFMAIAVAVICSGFAGTLCSVVFMIRVSGISDTLFGIRCVLREGPEEFGHVSVGPKHPDVPVGNRGDPHRGLHDGRGPGLGEGLLLWIHAVGLLSHL